MKATTAATWALFAASIGAFHPSIPTGYGLLAAATLGLTALAIVGARRRRPEAAERSAWRSAAFAIAGASAAIASHQAWDNPFWTGAILAVGGFLAALATMDGPTEEDGRLGWLHLYIDNRLKASRAANSGQKPHPNSAAPRRNKYADGYQDAMREVEAKIRNLRSTGRIQ